MPVLPTSKTKPVVCSEVFSKIILEVVEGHANGLDEVVRTNRMGCLNICLMAPAAFLSRFMTGLGSMPTALHRTFNEDF